MKHVWEMFNMDKLTYAKLPWEKKKEMLIRAGYVPTHPEEKESLSGSHLYDAWVLSRRERGAWEPWELHGFK